MPDPRLVGLYELRALIRQLNEANLRVTTTLAHLNEAGIDDEADVLLGIKQTLEAKLLPSSIKLLKSLEGGTIQN